MAIHFNSKKPDHEAVSWSDPGPIRFFIAKGVLYKFLNVSRIEKRENCPNVTYFGGEVLTGISKGKEVWVREFDGTPFDDEDGGIPRIVGIELL